MRKISVIITAYNSTEWLGEALQSAENQIWTDREIIVVDDGSNSERRTFIESVMARFPEARLVRQDNQGLSAARNSGVRVSTGEYLAFLDHDDIWAPEFTTTLVGKLEAEPKLDVAFCRIRHLSADGGKIGHASKGKLSGFSIRDLLISDPLCCGSSFVIRRECFESLGGFDRTYRRAEMPEFFIRFLEAGGQMEGVDRPMVFYRNTPGSLSGGRSLRQDRQRLLAQTFRKHPRLAFSPAIRIALFLNQMRIQLRRVLQR